MTVKRFMEAWAIGTHSPEAFGLMRADLLALIRQAKRQGETKGILIGMKTGAYMALAGRQARRGKQ